MDWLYFFWLFLKACLFSSGGRGPLPILHEDFLRMGWATDQQFAEAVAVGEISPGPTGLWIVSLGFLTGGYFGAVLSLVASFLPPFAVLAVNRIFARVKDYAATRGFVHGLTLAINAIGMVALVRVWASTQIQWVSIAIALACFGLSFVRRVPMWAMLLGGMALGAVFL
jgi:chromate transporter